MEKKEFIEKLKTRKFRNKLRRIHDSGRLKLGMIHTKEDPYWMDCFKILTCKNKDYEGKTIGEIARMRKSDALETVFDLLVEDPDITWVAFLDKRYAPALIPVLLKHPGAMPSTDTIALPAKIDDESSPFASSGALPGPVYYGLYPYYIGTYVREKGVLNLEEAVKKATYLPAKKFGLKDRGILRLGAYADIVVFDFDKIKMAGDFLHPNLPPEGINFVLINGIVVYKEKIHTGKKPGKVIRHMF